jgi:hypothetical protein
LLKSVGASDAERGAALRGALGKFRREHGLWQRDDLIAWMAANALDEPGLERLLSREYQLEREASMASAGLLRAMVDHLRMSGAFAAILQDARSDPP